MAVLVVKDGAGLPPTERVGPNAVFSRVRGVMRMSPSSVTRTVACRVIPTGVSWSVVAALSSATGAWLVCLTVIETVAVFESALPSFALKVKLSGPE